MGISLALRAGGVLAKKFLKKNAKKIIVNAGGGAGAAGMTAGFSIPGLRFPGIDIGKRGPGVFRTTTGGKAGRIEAGEMGACPPGYHLNKAKLADDTPPRSVCVRNRSMNFANGRAAKRSGRRLRGTVKMLKKSFTFVQAKKPAGKFIVKKGR